MRGIEKRKTVAEIRQLLENSDIKKWLSDKQLRKAEKMLYRAGSATGRRQKLLIAKLVLVMTFWGLKLK